METASDGGGTHGTSGRGRPTRRDVALLAVLALGLLASAHGLQRAVLHREALERMYGGAFRSVLTGLRGAVAVGALALATRALAAWRGRPPRPALFRRLFCTLVLGHAAFVSFSQPFERLHLDLALGLVAGAFAALVLFERPLSGILQPGPARALDFVLFQLCLLALCAELLLRVWGAVAPQPLFAFGGTGARRTIEAFRYEPGRVRFGFPFNSDGHYDEEFGPWRPDEPVVACIGDSFSIGTVPIQHHYTTVAERRLARAVYNFGVPSIGLPEYVYLLKNEVLPLRPDLVVVALFLGNDLHEGVGANRAHAWLRSWFDRDNVRLLVVPERLRRARREAAKLSRHGRAPALLAAEAGAAPDWLDDPTREKPGFTDEAFLRVESARAWSVCSPDEVDWELVSGYLEELLEAVGDTPLVFLLIPDEFQVDDELWERVSARVAERGAELERDRPQRLLADWLTERGVPHLDLLPVLRAVEPLADGRPHLYHRNDTHFNARGNRVAGEALGEFLGGR